MKVRICQTWPKLLDLEANLEEICACIQKGRNDGVNLSVFPELAMTGYFVGKQYHEVALRLDSPQVARLAKASKGTAAVVGFIEESPAMNFYNSALVLEDGNLVYSYRKLNLPNYGDFEERKIFSSGSSVPIFRLQGYTVAVLICNDMWHPSLPYLAITQEADIIVSIINSSEGSMGAAFSNRESWGLINKFYARIFGIYLLCANRAGHEEVLTRTPIVIRNGLEVAQPPSQDMHIFWGGSEIINPFGKQMAKAAIREPDEVTVELERDLLRTKRIMLPYLRQDDPFFTFRELGRILKDKEEGSCKVRDIVEGSTSP